MAYQNPPPASPSTPSGQDNSSSATQYSGGGQGGLRGDYTPTSRQHPSQPSDPSWVTKLLGCMWPHIAASAEKMAWEMMPDMLNQSKPTWMTSLSLDTFELGDVPPQIENIEVDPGVVPGADDCYMELYFNWHGQQNILLSINPAPKFSQKIPLVGKMIGKAMTWKVGVKDLVISGKLRTTFIPLLQQMPIVGAVQAAFVGMPHLDFKLELPEGMHAVVPMQYLDGWVDAFIQDNILSMYMLPGHFFTPIDQNARDILTPEGILEVQVLEAKNVPRMDLFGQSDPFVKVWLMPTKPQQSSTKSGANPSWSDEEAHWALPVHVRAHQELTVAVFDSDSVGADEIGRTRLPLADLQPAQLEDLWLTLNTPSQGDTAQKERSGTRDKLAGVLFGAKGSKSKDAEGCQVHVKLTFHPLPDETVREINKVQMRGQSPRPELIHDPEISQLIAKYDIMDELFPTSDKTKQHEEQQQQQQQAQKK